MINGFYHPALISSNFPIFPITLPVPPTNPSNADFKMPPQGLRATAARTAPGPDRVLYRFRRPTTIGEKCLLPLLLGEGRGEGSYQLPFKRPLENGLPQPLGPGQRLIEFFFDFVGHRQPAFDHPRDAFLFFNRWQQKWQFTTNL